jgi:hypothetical protein
MLVENRPGGIPPLVDLEFRLGNESFPPGKSIFPTRKFGGPPPDVKNRLCGAAARFDLRTLAQQKKCAALPKRGAPAISALPFVLNH